MTTAIALDVDGVIIPFDPRCTDSVTWVNCEGFDQPVRDEVIERLTTVTRQESVLGLWLSPWGRTAPATFADILGEDWSVLEPPQDQLVSPRYWWKADILARWAGSRTDVDRIIWCDDDIDNMTDRGSSSQLRSLCAERGIELYLINPDPRTGLLSVHLDAIENLAGSGITSG